MKPDCKLKEKPAGFTELVKQLGRMKESDAANIFITIFIDSCYLTNDNTEVKETRAHFSDLISRLSMAMPCK